MNIEMIRAAARRAKGHIRRTPLLESPGLNAVLGRRVLVKAENLQYTGSFKARGGWAALSALEPEVRARGVVAASSGNHAQGVARAAHAHGAPAKIIMPSDAPQSKIDGTLSWGAEIIWYDRYKGNRDATADEIVAREGSTFISPYDYPETIAGQGTCGLEIAAQTAELGIENADVVICTGGGGLASGIALALEADAPGMRIHLAEPEHYDDWHRSLASGKIEENDFAHTSLCDAVLSKRPGELTFPIVQPRAASGLVVSDDNALRAVGLYFQHLKLVVEPGGAVALAAALKHKNHLKEDVVIVTATGGNVDPPVFAKALATLESDT